MATTTNYYSSFSATIDTGVTVSGGSTTTAKEITSTGLKYDVTYSVANASEQTIYTAATAATGTAPVFFWMESSQDVQLKVTNASDECFVILIKATTPFSLGSLTSDSKTTDIALPATLEAPKTLAVYNNSGSAATVRVTAIK